MSSISLCFGAKAKTMDVKNGVELNKTYCSKLLIDVCTHIPIAVPCWEKGEEEISETDCRVLSGENHCIILSLLLD